MHRFQSKSTITRLRFAALFICLKWLLIPATAGILVYSILQHDNRLTWIAMGLGFGTVCLTIIQWILSSRVRCPLCMTPVLAAKRCSKHRNAKKALGSYRLRVALTVLLKGRFYCPYCHEPSVLAVRDRRIYSQAKQR